MKLVYFVYIIKVYIVGIHSNCLSKLGNSNENQQHMLLQKSEENIAKASLNNFLNKSSVSTSKSVRLDLTFTTLSANSADDKLTFLLFFPRKQNLTISCKLSPLKILPRVLRVKEGNNI